MELHRGITQMKNISRPLFAALTVITTAAVAADLPPVPAESIAQKKELLFSDDFEGAEPAKVWHKVVPTFAVEKGVLKGTQTRDVNIPATDGKRAVTAHAAVHGLEIPTKDSVVECRIRLDGATFVSVEFDDRKYTDAHYGHICLAQVRTNGITIIDQRDGNMRNDIYEMSKDPTKKPERAKLLMGRQVAYPAKVEAGKWHTLVVESVGDAMRVTLDGKPAAYHKSSGIGHATKSKIEFGVGGKDGYFDDLKVWNAEPTRR
ncbi:MAG TPA: hypothetical protein VK530_07545 [Candidatus Acidoferrum sp.]|nr:hypothetical protein [Candidatus Acidoferrum sp.]